jgi:hypothetical protein
MRRSSVTPLDFLNLLWLYKPKSSDTDAPGTANGELKARTITLAICQALGTGVV